MLLEAYASSGSVDVGDKHNGRQGHCDGREVEIPVGHVKSVLCEESTGVHQIDATYKQRKCKVKSCFRYKSTGNKYQTSVLVFVQKRTESVVNAAVESELADADDGWSSDPKCQDGPHLVVRICSKVDSLKTQYEKNCKEK